MISQAEMTQLLSLTEDDLDRRKKAIEIVKLERESDNVSLLMEQTRKGIEKLNYEISYQERQKAEAEALDKVNGTYHFYDTVTKDSIKEAIGALNIWHRRFPTGDLKIVLTSPGGSILDGLALYDFIKFLREDHEVETIALGTAASMGSVLLQAGSKRSIGRHSFMLIHEPSSGSVGKASELEDHLEFLGKIQDVVLDIYAERSTMTARQIKNKWKNKDWWLSAEECLALGFVDAIC